ncbi:MAG TPA: DUF1800 domain-containing protein [Bryobacteraceae bacterium]|nr:DUF1800 domain-containing protein [Bryobacteraceae bacterium]
MTDRAAARFLDQATWGPTPASIAALQKMGVAKWLAWQFSVAPSDLPDQDVLRSDGKSNNNLAPVQAAFFQNAVTGEDQLRQRVAFILSQIWVVSQVTVRPAYAFPPYWRIFRDNAFGNYRDIIKAVTLSPAMGRYLNMANNNKGNAAKGTAANENYARELMQLFTLGLIKLNPDGSPVLDANNKPIPTYDQTVVTNMARVLTGWTYPTAPGATPKGNNPAWYVGQMFPVQFNHDTTAKVIFDNIAIPAGQTAEQDLDSLVDALMAQPSIAPFISRQLIEHMVTSNPSAAYVERIANVFSKTSGNMKAVIRAVLTDPEARAGDDPNAAPNPAFGHLREPILFMANVVRGLNGTVTETNALNSSASQMGENLFNAASVFSYFSPQYRTAGGLFGPEFQIYSTQTAAERADVISKALYGSLDKITKLDLSPFVAQAGNADNLLDYVSYVFLHHAMSPDLAQAAADAANAAVTPTGKAQAALYIALTSSEYQVVQ